MDKMNRYSTEFDAGQIGMIRIDGATKGSLQDDVPENDDPAEVLRGIEELQNNVNSVDNATAVSIVFLMKSVQISQNVSGTPIADLAEDPPPSSPRRPWLSGIWSSTVKWVPRCPSGMSCRI